MNEYRSEIIQELKDLYTAIEQQISDRIDEFDNIGRSGNDEQIFRELCFCILSSGVGPRVAERSLNAIGDKLLDGPENKLIELLDGVHKYPGKASYLYTTRLYLKENFDLKLGPKLNSIDDPEERRDFIANNKGIKGIGYVQASHFLRNIGFRGYAILDKNILRTLYEFGIIEDIKPPASKKRYVLIENKMKEFSSDIGINIDRLDLLLWFRKTNKIPR